MNTEKKYPLCLLVILLVAGITTVNAQDYNSYSDAEITAIAAAANEIDVETAELARQKSDNEAVLNYANTMINDHTAVLNQAQNLINRLGLTPKENDLSNQLRTDAEQARNRLQSLEGQEFNEAYINHEISYHQKVIETVRDQLIPNADNEELKTLLEGIMPTLESHLRHAEDVQAKLGR